jgi:TonB family protein
LKKASIAVSVLIHLVILLAVLPVNNNIPAPKKDKYKYLSINAVLLNNQPAEHVDPVPERTEATELTNQNTFITGNSESDPNKYSEKNPENTGKENAKYDYYPLSMVNTKPALLEKSEFIFPAEAKKNNITEADVMVEILLNEEGEIFECRITDPAGYGFDEAVIEMFKGARFSPALINNIPVPVKIKIPVHCILED